MPMSPRLLRPRAAGGFDPRAISGLAVWLDAADSATLFDATTGGSLVTANSGVGRWADKSGNGRNATQGTANNRPLRRVASQNGLDGVEFDGTNDVMSTASFTHTVQFTLFIVHKMLNVSPAAYSRIIEHGSNNGLAIVNTDNSGTGTNRYGLQYASSAFVNSNEAFSTATRLLRYSSDDSTTRNLSFSVDGGADFTFTRTGTPSSPSVLWLASFGGGQLFTSQVMYEVCYYGRLLTASESSAIGQYLRTKWRVY